MLATAVLAPPAAPRWRSKPGLRMLRWSPRLAVADVVRVRTGETGAIAERMEGGMQDRQAAPV